MAKYNEKESCEISDSENFSIAWMSASSSLAVILLMIIDGLLRVGWTRNCPGFATRPTTARSGSRFGLFFENYSLHFAHSLAGEAKRV